MFRYKTAWQKASAPDKAVAAGGAAAAVFGARASRPKSEEFSGVNPGVKMSRNSKPKSIPREKRYEMI